MTTTILQEYLDENLLDLVKEDNHVEYLKSASAAIVKHLKTKKHRHKIIDYTLIALNSQINQESELFIEIENIIKGEWKRFVGLYKSNDKPYSVIRAVLLNAIEALTKNDINNTAIVWLTSNNYFRYVHLKSDRESNIIKNFIEKLGNRYESHAVSTWSSASSNTEQDITPVQINGVSNFSAPSFNGATMFNGVESIIPNSNRNLRVQLYSSQFNNWYESFKSNVVKNLTSLINASLSTLTQKQNNELTKIRSELNTELTKISTTIKSNIIEARNQTEYKNTKSELVWWKESMYSKCMKKSYRDMTSTAATLSIAYDCYKLMPDYFPVSVDYFLKEVLRKTYPGEKEVLFEKVLDFDEVDTLNNLFSGEKHISEFSLLTHISSYFVKANKIIEETGIRKEAKMSIYDIAVWIFHDLQANSLVNQQND